MSTATESSVSQTENLYEGMFLLNSSRFATDPEGVAGQVLGILEKAGATIVAHRPWQDGKLAYAIEGHRKGLHYLVLFRMSGGGIPEVNRACKLNETVLRQLIIKHPQSIFDANVAALNPDGANEQVDDDAGEKPESPEATESPEAKTDDAEAKE